MFVDKPNVVAQSLGALRIKIAKELGLIDENKLNFLWVTDWPLLEYDEDAKRYVAHIIHLLHLNKRILVN